MDAVVGHQLPANTGFLTRAARAARQLAEAITKWRDQRQQQRAFERLDARLLADVGFVRESQSEDSVQWVWWT